MAKARADDGTGLYWEERGSGPTVLFVPYWSLHPSVWEPLSAELESDHRLVRYDDRGTGGSDRVGPYDMETAARDLETVAEAVGGGPAVAVGLVDASHRAVRVAARRPDLISHVVSLGGAPLARSALAGLEAMISSNTVVAAFRQQLEADYRGAVRSIMEAANMQMSQDELRARVAAQIEHVPGETAAARLSEWAEDETAATPARELGDRMTVVLSAQMGGGWFPEPPQLIRVIAEHLPEARVLEHEDGIVSRPDLAAGLVRELEAAERSADVPGGARA